jgi:BirA family biotin operon repressor/biotin-[acetyl-CoA-carboxylase] ligase
MITKLNWKFKTKYQYYLVDTIPSTNTYLKDNFNEYPDKTILIALEQTNGRGRYDRKWRSDKDIMFSILLKNNGNYEIITPLAICLALDSYGFKCGIKWPNDVYLNDKKLSGILIEDVFQLKFEASIIGIGINMTDKESVMGIGLNKNIDKYDLINSIMNNFDNLNKLNHDELIKLYRERSIVYNRKVYYKDKIYIAKDIDIDGHLILNDGNNKIVVSSDEINIKESLL